MASTEPLEIGRTGSTGRFALTSELGIYAEAFRQHWRLVLGMGFLFGWLLSFPLQGPLISVLALSRNLSPLPFITTFLIGIIASLLISGISGYYKPGLLNWFPLGTIVCIAVTVSLTSLPASTWPILFALMGLFAGSVMISWGAILASSTRPGQRGRVFAMGAALANLFLYLINQVCQLISIDFLLAGAAFLLIWVPVVIMFRSNLNGINLQLANNGKSFRKPLKIASYWPVMAFIFTINAVAGLMYLIIGNLATQPIGLLTAYGYLPYIVLLFVAGSLADIKGRRNSAILGAIMVGAGFMLLGLIRGPLQYIVIQTLVVGGYAFLDVFTWTVPADLAYQKRAPLYYGLVLGMNVLAILVGVLLGESLSEVVSGGEIMTVSLTGLLAVASLGFIFRLRETLHVESLPVVQNLDDYSDIYSKNGFTPRETDVAKLMINGASTQEILTKLAIAPDTLKVHLRNIYRKAGVRNRLEFTLSIMQSSSTKLSGKDESV